MKEFYIGDVVVIKKYEDAPKELRTNGMARLRGEKGTIIDKLYSESNNCYVYTIKFDNFEAVSHKKWRAELLDKYVEKQTTYRYEVEIVDNVVIVILYEVDTDDVSTEIARGHGHIIHEGPLGVAQATSYASKKIYEKLGGYSNGRV